MAPNKSRVKVIVYIGGNIIQDDWSVEYDCPHKAIFRIRRDTSFQLLLSNLYERFEIDNTRFTLKVRGKLFRLYGDRVKSMLCEISTDQDLEMFLDPEEGNDSMDIFVQTIPLYNNAPPPQLTFDLNEPYNIVSQLSPKVVAVTQGFSSMQFTNFGAGTSAPPTNFGGGNRGETSTRREVRHPNTNEPTEDFTDIPGDFFGVDPPVDSEPSDQKDYDNIDGDHDHDDGENVANVPHNMPSVAPTQNQPHLYEPIPFYSMDYEEMMADSFDIPDGQLSKFYDADEGVIEKGMIFKSKNRRPPRCGTGGHLGRH
ncbi:PREDICTED: uncharacterized protein LOC105960425 [Erythranthe guttata]|uniref:uncharacterized protein LOC105960425 n=1 Tax=Erythranthe guttata TaxID=4155 RepID=UPI00064DCBC6|nr:PREDICTED: uncharacterized protein LOC105960425 [Erythranthe guttata]XP_012840049.1 PREDICTED: uncharacterized protein LOC105960425 [Erythranthe guttata]XP_012840050.1 PREDICTED: uncharacterized protein LOC105960425 [Erythranthe guttata]|eukprot:XP_012840048.1 PREDICTED: uncharacterized protein LOC105960425 [Erythranthe guttata]